MYHVHIKKTTYIYIYNCVYIYIYIDLRIGYLGPVPLAPRWVRRLGDSGRSGVVEVSSVVLKV